MAIKGYFFNAVYDSSTQTYDREYNAEDITGYLKLLIRGGVFPNPSTNLQVLENSGMNITVKAGSGWFADGRKIEVTADYVLTVTQSDVLLPRIDRVVMYADYVNRTVGLAVVAGTPAVNPTAPALTRNSSRYEYGLATILVGSQVTAITQSAITDTRADTNVCGWVTGLIDQVDTATLFLQWQTAYEEFYSDMETWKTSQETSFEGWEADQKAAFEAWLQDLTDELNVDTYNKVYRKSETFTTAGYHYITLSWTNYTYDESDIVDVYINGLKLTRDEFDLVTTGGSPAPYVGASFNATGYGDVMEVQVLKSVIGFNQG